MGRRAEYAEEILFAQSGDDDWAKDSVFRRAMFLFVVVSRQTKTEILCASAVIHSFSAIICVNLRLKAPNALPYAPCALLFPARVHLLMPKC